MVYIVIIIFFASYQNTSFETSNTWHILPFKLKFYVSNSVFVPNFHVCRSMKTLFLNHHYFDMLYVILKTCRKLTEVTMTLFTWSEMNDFQISGIT